MSVDLNTGCFLICLIKASFASACLLDKCGYVNIAKNTQKSFNEERRERRVLSKTYTNVYFWFKNEYASYQTNRLETSTKDQRLWKNGNCPSNIAFIRVIKPL